MTTGGNTIGMAMVARMARASEPSRITTAFAVRTSTATQRNGVGSSVEALEIVIAGGDAR